MIIWRSKSDFRARDRPHIRQVKESPVAVGAETGSRGGGSCGVEVFLLMRDNLLIVAAEMMEPPLNVASCVRR